MSQRTPILVTGAAGFIGSHLVEALLNRGERVIGLDELNDYYDPRVKERNLTAALEHEGFTLLRGDIRDRDLVREIFQTHRPALVYHLAARAGVRPSVEDPALYQSVNVEGTVTLFDAARANGCEHFVFASSSSVYGAGSKVPFSEEDPADQPVSPYAATKRAGELIAHSYSHLYGLQITALRFFTVYGPRQRPDMAIHKFTRLIDEGQTLPIFGEGKTYRDYTYIEDCIQGVLKAGARGPEHGLYRCYNLGEARTVELLELVRLIGEALGQTPKLEHLPEQPGDVPRTSADLDRVKVELGYDPNFPIEEGIRRFVAWYREQPK